MMLKKLISIMFILSVKIARIIHMGNQFVSGKNPIVNIKTLPSDIWKIIIQYAYPLDQGWNNHLWQIAKVCKMYHSIVESYFQIFLKNPRLSRKNVKYESIVSRLIFREPKYMTFSNYIKYITKDAPVMPPGYLYEGSPIFTYCRSPIKFSYYSKLNKQYFLDMYFLERYWISNCYTNTDVNNKVEYTNEMPIIIIPTTHNIVQQKYFKRICHFFIVQHWMDDIWIILFYHYESYHYRESEIKKVMQKIDTKYVMEKLIPYLQTTEVVPNSLSGFLDNINNWWSLNHDF